MKRIEWKSERREESRIEWKRVREVIHVEDSGGESVKRNCGREL